MEKNPTLKQERKLWREGYRFVVGLDEAGRGPLAGPVIACAITARPISNFKFLISKQIQNPNVKNSKQFGILKFGHLDLFRISDLGFRILLREVRDSKKLTSQKREKLYKILIKNPRVQWGIGKVSERVIDKINILEATKLAMKKAVRNLNNKLIKEIKIAKNSAKTISHISDGRQKNVIIDYLVLDGNFGIDLNIPQKSIVRGDEKVFSCAMASIIAKVTRDRIMLRLHKKYPNYGFDKHKGYPTKLHYQKIAKFGICKIHRKTFRLD